MESEDLVKLQLEELQKLLGKKQKFEDVVFSLKSLLQQNYPSASPSLRKSAADYLEIKSLLDLTCQTVARIFNLTKGFTPDMEDRVRRENPWAFQSYGRLHS